VYKNQNPDLWKIKVSDALKKREKGKKGDREGGETERASERERERKRERQKELFYPCSFFLYIIKASAFLFLCFPTF
jgi:hypothetical protein